MASIAQPSPRRPGRSADTEAIQRWSMEGTMTRLTIGGALLACVSLLASPVYAQPKATAEIKDASGKLLGEAVLAQRDGAGEIDVTLSGLPKVTHAVHLHQVGGAHR